MHPKHKEAFCSLQDRKEDLESGRGIRGRYGSTAVKKGKSVRPDGLLVPMFQSEFGLNKTTATERS